ncbi:elongator complex protein 4-like [Amphiura filiformis]|uniref:elongator complex protein 4-like n=1 Tax=Amphiura filiformis TaxID=82378 RepID=UPI003B2240A4
MSMAAPMANQATSFQKKSRSRGLQILGTRPSLHNGQLLVSTGVPSLDFVLGGGIAVGSVLLIEEDTYGNYAQLLLSYYLAEGVMTQHHLCLASGDEKPHTILKNLPCPEEDPISAAAEGNKRRSGKTNEEETMKIAWRYQHLPKHQSNPASHRFGHYYDLSRVMSAEQLSSTPCSCFYLADHWSGKTNTSDCLNPVYKKLFQHIENQVAEGGFSLTQLQTQTQAKERTVLRIAIHSLGSALWGDEPLSDRQTGTSLCQFLHALRALLRNSLAVCVITIPTHVFQDSGLVRRLERLCDTAVQLESFAGSDQEKNPAYKEYHGLFHIKQLPRLNSLTCHMPDSLDLAFKLKRKKLTIEKLHLPPDLSETMSRSQADHSSIAPSLGCASSTSKGKLDF